MITILNNKYNGLVVFTLDNLLKTAKGIAPLIIVMVLVCFVIVATVALGMAFL